MKSIYDLPTPAVLVDVRALELNIHSMQETCDAGATALWPHCKTHKMVEVLKRQLAAGAQGATFAKVGEAEALLPAGVENVFIAHSLVQPDLAPRLSALRSRVNRLVLAVTSEAQLTCLEDLLRLAGVHAEALIAVDTGLGREGTRTPEQIAQLASRIRESKVLDLLGIYTHEGHGYAQAAEDLEGFVRSTHAKLLAYRDAVGGDLGLWPGCSVTSAAMTGRAHVVSVRPGAYVFSDLSLSETNTLIPWDRIALTVLTTVVDVADEQLALVDAGSKVFSSDRSMANLCGREFTQRHLALTRVNEEHGYVSWTEGRAPRIQDKLRFVPAHVCPVVNLTDQVYVVDGEEVVDTWTVDARGMTR